jgi:hypothetical protein
MESDTFHGYEYATGGEHPNAWAQLEWMSSVRPSLHAAHKAILAARRAIVAADAKAVTIRLSDGGRVPPETFHAETKNSLDVENFDDRFRVIEFHLERLG